MAASKSPSPLVVVMMMMAAMVRISVYLAVNCPRLTSAAECNICLPGSTAEDASTLAGPPAVTFYPCKAAKKAQREEGRWLQCRVDAIPPCLRPAVCAVFIVERRAADDPERATSTEYLLVRRPDQGKWYEGQSS